MKKEGRKEGLLKLKLSNSRPESANLRSILPVSKHSQANIITIVLIVLVSIVIA